MIELGNLLGLRAAVYALANAGIAISPQTISLIDSDSLGIVSGLVIGKPVGIWLAC